MKFAQKYGKKELKKSVTGDEKQLFQ